MCIIQCVRKVAVHIRLRYVDLVVSIDVAVEVCCCFSVFSTVSVRYGRYCANTINSVYPYSMWIYSVPVPSSAISHNFTAVTC
jgi:hypothetical protein